MKRPIRQIRIEGNIAFVPLTYGYEAVIDAADVPLVSGRNWYARVDRNTVYAMRTGPRPKQPTIRMHRVIMALPDGAEVDHINGNGLDNRRENLRSATTQQNQQNARIRSDNSTGFKGVTFDRAQGKYYAQINHGGKKKFLGRYSTAEEAHEAYCKASRAYHGDFSRVG